MPLEVAGSVAGSISEAQWRRRNGRRRIALWRVARANGRDLQAIDRQGRINSNSPDFRMAQCRNHGYRSTQCSELGAMAKQCSELGA